MDILFEKIIQDNTINTEYLIEISQKRQEFREDIEYGRDCHDHATAYYNMLCNLMTTMKQKRSTLCTQPLFHWQGHASSSWLYEKMNVERAIADAVTKKAQSMPDPKVRRNLYMSAIAYSIKSLDTVESVSWEDASVTHMDIFQPRFHLYHILKSTAMYYMTMNDYSVRQKGEPNSLCIKRAYEYMDTAAHVWKRNECDTKEALRLKALYTLDYVKNMDDGKCGEKVALLEPFVNSSVVPEELGTHYKMLVQCNNAVYYAPVETSIVLRPSSLTDLVHTLPKTTECT